MRYTSAALIALVLLTSGCRWIARYRSADAVTTSDAHLDTTPDLGVDTFPDAMSDLGIDTLPTDLGVDTFPDAMSDTLPPDAGLTCSGTVVVQKPIPSCIPTSVGTCKNGSTITVTVPYANADSWSHSLVQGSTGQPIGLGTVNNASTKLSACNGNLVISWTLPGVAGGDAGSVDLTVTFKNKGGGSDFKTLSIITVK